MLIRALSLCCLLLMSACSQVLVKDLHGSVNDLSRFDSYRWGWPALAGGGRHDQDLMLQDRVVRGAVDRRLAGLGLVARGHDQQAALVVGYRILFRPQQFAGLDQSEGGWVWTRDAEGELQRSRVEPNSAVTLDRVTLRITVFNGDKSQVVWEAEASELVGQGHPPKQMAAAIEKMVEGLFSR